MTVISAVRPGPVSTVVRPYYHEIANTHVVKMAFLYRDVLFLILQFNCVCFLNCFISMHDLFETNFYNSFNWRKNKGPFNAFSQLLQETHRRGVSIVLSTSVIDLSISSYILSKWIGISIHIRMWCFITWAFYICTPHYQILVPGLIIIPEIQRWSWCQLWRPWCHCRLSAW